MIRSRSLSRLAGCHNNIGGSAYGKIRRSAAAAVHRRPIILTCHNHYFGTEAAAVYSSTVDNNNDDYDGAGAGKMPQSRKPKFVSFFTEVDEIMKRDSPAHYQRFLDSKTASESWRAMQQRNEQARRQMERGRKASSKGSLQQDDVVGDTSPIFDSGYGKKNDFATVSTSVAIEEDENETPSSYNRHSAIAYATSTSDGDTNTDSDGESETTSLGSTLPKKYQSFMQGISQSSSAEQSPTTSTNTTLLSNNETDTNKTTPTKKTTGGGIFSSISKSALELKDENGGSTSIPLSELFPTLYGSQKQNSESTSKSPNNKKPTNPAMMYNEDHYEVYQEAMMAVLEVKPVQKHLAKIEQRGELQARIVQRVKDWLLSDHRVVEANVVKERWDAVSEIWKNEKWMTGIAAEDTTTTSSSSEEKSNFHIEMEAQRELFLSRIHDEDVELMATSSSSFDSADKETTEATTSAVEPLTVEEMNLIFHEVALHIMGALGRYCARRARSAPMEVGWSKVKESGVLLQDHIATYMYVVSTMGMTDSIGGSIGLFGSYPFSDNKKDEDDESVEKADAFHIPEEVSMYHDLCSKPTEASISLQVKAMSSKGNAKDAEDLLEAFKVRKKNSSHLLDSLLLLQVSHSVTHTIITNASRRNLLMLIKSRQS